jgi:hypothetical protein
VKWVKPRKPREVIYEDYIVFAATHGRCRGGPNVNVYEFQGFSAYSRRMRERELFTFAKLTEITKRNLIDFI